MKKFAIIFGRGRYVERNIQLIKNNKSRPLIVDYDPTNPFFADNHYCLIKKNQELKQIESFLNQNQGRISFIINRADTFVELHSRLVDHFQVPGPSFEATSFFRDKSLLHQTMVDHELEFFRPRTIVINLEEIDTYLKQIQFPIVVKPFMGAHSKAVMLINNLQELEEAKVILQNHFQTSKAVKFHKQNEFKILIEEYLDGKMVSPICYVNKKGKVNILTYFDIVRAKDLGQDNMQLVYRTAPSKYPQYITQRIQFILQRLARITGLQSTFLDPEFMVVGKKVYLIEINVRAGGFRYESMKYGFGLDIDQMSIDLARDKELNDDFNFVKSNTALEFWEEKSGKITQLKFPNSKAIKEIQIITKQGDQYLSPPEGNKAIAKLFVVSDKDSLKIAKEIRKKIEIKIS